jgi:hypothetical protein
MHEITLWEDKDHFRKNSSRGYVRFHRESKAPTFDFARFPSARRSCWLLREIEEWAESRPISDFLPPPNTAAGGRNGKPNSQNVLPITQDAQIE